MLDIPIKEKTAIAGIGWTDFSRNAGASTLTMAIRAGLNAIEDAGLEPSDIDGVVSYFYRYIDSASPKRLADALGLQCNFHVFGEGGGTWSCAAVLSAAMLVHSGLCRNVLVFRARNTYSENRKRAGSVGTFSGRDEQFRTPFGEHLPATMYAHNATAYMAKYGATSLDFAHLAVTQRKHAMLNRKAMMRTPMTIEDHQASRMISYPYRLLDCCLQSDGAVALVVTSAERARDLRHRPVTIVAGTGSISPIAGSWETNGVNAAPILYERADIKPSDLSFAQLYDPFTAMCMLHIENFGLTEQGSAAAWVKAGHNALDGQIPVNTHGGLLSEAHVHGLNHVVEAVQQLRPGGVIDDLCEGPHTYDRSTCRQVRDPEFGLVCGEEGESALILRRG